ncbi:hypothetical protein G9A89_014851 [Geosiphon pyriformis]|nr:hypothetical protein G9A89_014851 [Geosiphon pyriformis]
MPSYSYGLEIMETQASFQGPGTDFHSKQEFKSTKSISRTLLSQYFHSLLEIPERPAAFPSGKLETTSNISLKPIEHITPENALSKT